MNEALKSDEKSAGHPGRFWIGFFIGGFPGAILLFFLGTQEGKKAGRSLEEQGKDILDELLDRFNSLEQKGKQLVREGEHIKEGVIEQLEVKKEELTDSATEKIDSALAHIEALQERGRETTASLRKRLFKNLPKKV